MTHSNMWRDCTVWLTWLIHMVPRVYTLVVVFFQLDVWHDSFVCVTWLIIMCDMTRTHDVSFIYIDIDIFWSGCVTWLVRICDVTHLYAWRDSFVCDAFIQIVNWYVLQRPNPQHAATRCNTLQHAAPRCNTLQHAATHRSTYTHVTALMWCCIYTNWQWYVLQQPSPQHTATLCNSPQHTVAHMHTWQHSCRVAFTQIGSGMFCSSQTVPQHFQHRRRYDE